jgi:hypothetical protein
MQPTKFELVIQTQDGKDAPPRNSAHLLGGTAAAWPLAGQLGAGDDGCGAAREDSYAVLGRCSG